MPKKGGLGRGLDALIPVRSGNTAGRGKKSSDTDASEAGASTKKKAAAAGGGTASGKKKDESVGDGAVSGKKKAALVEGEPDSGKKGRTGGRNKGSKSEEKKSKSAKAGGMKAGEEKAGAIKSAAKQADAAKFEAEAAGMLRDAADTALSGVPEASGADKEAAAADGVVLLKTSEVEPNRSQPRKYFDDAAIAELSDSIKKFGVISPLLVQRKDGYYEIIAGERRWRAAKKAGLKKVPVIIRDYSEREAVEVSLIENIQREDLNPIEEAKAYDRLVQDYGLNQEEVAERVSKSRSAVANSMRLLRLDPLLQTMVETGALSEGHGRAILALGAAELQKKAAELVVKDRLSVRQTEKLVRDLLAPGAGAKKKRVNEERVLMLEDLAGQLKESLGTKVSIHQSGRKKGKIEIEYYSDEDLDRIFELLMSV